MHRQEAARGLVDVHDAVCANSVLVHQPAVRVGVLLLRAVELFHALGGLCVAQPHATQELLDPPLAGTDVESLCVQLLENQATDRHRGEA